MSTKTATADDLFDRPWRAGQPFRVRGSRRRRVLMFLVLVLLSFVIGAYSYITDSDRVRGMASQYLSQLFGGKVEIRKASLSIFEGLRLDGVSLSVQGESGPDAKVFTAVTLLIKYDVEDLLAGRLKAVQITAVEPHVLLCEDEGRVDRPWNFQRLLKFGGEPGPGPTSAPAEQPVLPEILLRNGRIEDARIRNGEYLPGAAVAIDGSWSRIADSDRYRFDLDSRGLGLLGGPSIRGAYDMRTGKFEAALNNIVIGPMARMLPSQVRDWMEAHKIAGGIDVPVFEYRSPTDYKVKVHLRDVGLTFHPDEWLDSHDREALLAARRSFALLKSLGLPPSAAMSALDQQAQGRAIAFSDVTGALTFTPSGIEIGPDNSALVVAVEHNQFEISGAIDGYSLPDQSQAPAARIRIVSHNFKIPESPRYIASMPAKVREIYYKFMPSGRADLALDLERAEDDGPLVISGTVDILDWNFRYKNFPFDLQRAHGQLRVGRDADTGADRIDLVNVVGYGAAGGPNENGAFTVNGSISPLNDLNEVKLDVTAQNLTLDRSLFDALDPSTRSTIALFAAPGEPFPSLHGGFHATIFRPFGPMPDYRTNVDLSIEDATAQYAAFPYRLEHLSGGIRIRAGHVDLDHITAKQPGGLLVVDGRVETPVIGPAKPLLKVHASSLSVDDRMLAALPPREREALQKLGLAGRVDVDGSAFPLPAAPGSDEAEMSFDLAMHLHDALLRPNGADGLSELAAELRVRPGRIDVNTFSGRHGAGSVRGSATIATSGAAATDSRSAAPAAAGTSQATATRLSISADAKDLPLDASLRAQLPEDAQEGWDAVAPEGSVDAHIDYASILGADAGAPAPAILVVIHPKALAATPRAIPYRLTDLAGAITITPGAIDIDKVSGKHGKGTLIVSGHRDAEKPWHFAVDGENLALDDDLKKALGESIEHLASGLALSATVGVHLTDVQVEPPAPATRPAPGALASGPSSLAPGSTITIVGKVKLDIASMDVGIPVTEALGEATFDKLVLSGDTFHSLDGAIDFSSLEMAGHPAKNFHADLSKPADRAAMQFLKMQAQAVGGDLAGQVDVGFATDRQPGRYAMVLVLKGADVKQLTGANDNKGQGKLTASLNLEGIFDQPASRRGRGDVLVSGKDLYHIPLVLGLLNITNLTLPISSPFNEASTRYAVDGQHVTFDQIELRAGTMMMAGAGSLDFDSKKVHLTLVTDSDNAFKIPLLNPIIQGARKELLQVHVNGTIQEPKVSASSMSTFTTTIDEVFSGSDRSPDTADKKPRKGK